MPTVLPPAPGWRRLAGIVATAVAAALLLPASAGAVVGPWQVNDQSQVRLISPWELAPRQGELRLGLEFRIIPGWHVYWSNSGDAGFPPSLDFSPTPELSAATLLWPAPQRYELRGGLVSFGYEDHVIYPVTARIDAPAGDRLTLAADLDYLVCEEDCLPYSYRLSLEQPLVPAGTPPVPAPEVEVLDLWWARLPRPVEEVAGVTTRGRLDLSTPAAPRLVIEVEGAGARANGPGPEIFFAAQDLFDLGRPEVDVGEASLRFTLPLELERVDRELPPEVELAWTVTSLAAVDPQAAEVQAIEARRRVATGVTQAATEGRRDGAGPFASRRRGAVATLLQAAGGGLLLGLTPTALAVLLAQLLALGQLSRRGDLGLLTAARRAAAVGVGILVGFWGIAAAARWTSGDTAAVTWGMQLQEPVLLAGLAAVALLLALNLWNLLDLPLRRGRSDAPASPAGGGLLAGLVVSFLSLAWNVPWLGEAAGAALAAGPMSTFGAATAAGAALALPYLLLALIPSLLGRLARPARRLGEIPHGTGLLGFLVSAGLLWLLYLLAHQLTAEGLAQVELLLLMMALVVWLRRQARRRVVTWTLGAVLLLAAALLLRVADENRLYPRERDRTAAVGEDSSASLTASPPHRLEP